MSPKKYPIFALSELTSTYKSNRAISKTRKGSGSPQLTMKLSACPCWKCPVETSSLSKNISISTSSEPATTTCSWTAIYNTPSPARSNTPNPSINATQNLCTTLTPDLYIHTAIFKSILQSTKNNASLIHPHFLEENFFYSIASVLANKIITIIQDEETSAGKISASKPDQHSNETEDTSTII